MEILTNQPPLLLSLLLRPARKPSSRQQWCALVVLIDTAMSPRVGPWPGVPILSSVLVAPNRKSPLFPAEELLQRRLELVVLERVHERIDAAVDEDGDDSEMVEVAVEVDREAEAVHGEVDLVGRPAVDEVHAHHRHYLDDIAARFGGGFMAFS